MLADKFWSKVRKSDACWEWSGSRNGQGYGLFWNGKRNIGAHRFAWMLMHGDPGQMNVCHKCDNPPCVRPDHLFLGTTADNVRDMWVKGRNKASITAKLASKTHCPRGHPYSAENLMVGRQGRGGIKRMCRACYRSRSNRQKLEKRGGRPAYGGRPASTAKLNRDDIIAIYRGSDSGETNKALASRFGISETSISQILRGISYKADVAVARALLDEPAKEGKA